MIENHQQFNFHAAHGRFGVLVVCLTALWCGHVPGLQAAELLVGTASTSITPDEPVALSGQFHTRVAKTVESPVTANVLVLESRDGDKSLDLAIMVSCDLVVIREDIQSRIRSRGCRQAARGRCAEALRQRDPHAHRTGDGRGQVRHTRTKA